MSCFKEFGLENITFSKVIFILKQSLEKSFYGKLKAVFSGERKDECQGKIG